MKTFKVLPLHKKDELNKNYRPMSLLPALSKIIDKIIFNQPNLYFTSHNSFCGNQYGLRSEHTKELVALHLMDYITNQMDKGNIHLDLHPFRFFTP